VTEAKPTGSDPGPVAFIAANLRAERARAGHSLSAVARLAGISKSTLSQLEAGQGNPSVETLWAIAVALDVPFARLVAPPKNPMRVIRAGERPAVTAAGSAYSAALLAPGAHERRDLYAVTLEPGHPHRSEPHLRGTVEHVVVAQGAALVGPDGALIELRAGDYGSFPGDVAHSYEALEPGTWITLVMEHTEA